MQILEFRIAALEFARPVRIFEQLVEEQVSPTLLRKSARELYQCMLREIKIVEVNIETRTYIPQRLTLARATFLRQRNRHIRPLGLYLFYTGQQKIRFADTTSAFDGNQPIVPVDLVH